MTATIGVGDGPGAIVAAKDGPLGQRRVRRDARPHRPAIQRGHQECLRRQLAAGPGRHPLRPMGRGAGLRGGQPPRRHPDRSGLTSCLTVTRCWHTTLAIPALATVYDGLVALRRSGGAPGLTLVPDLARTLPRPADGGTTYTFTLRRGIRYSNGSLVRASDFRRGIMRQLSFGAYPALLRRHPRRPSVPPGPAAVRPVRRDRHRRRGGHGHLSPGPRRPRLPLQTRADPRRSGPARRPGPRHRPAPFLPGTGPYKISQYRPDVSLTLVRNPYFRQWSYAAQPAGYPTVIRFDQVAEPSASRNRRLSAGRADLAEVTATTVSFSRPGTRPACTPA